MLTTLVRTCVVLVIVMWVAKKLFSKKATSTPPDKNFWNTYVDNYNAVHLNFEWEALQGVISKPGNVSILDFGTGIGMVPKQMKTLFGQRANQTGIDIYRPQVWFGGSDVQFILYDGLSLPFGDNTFDLVVARYVLHHIPVNEHALDELIRVSKSFVYLVEDIVDRTTWAGMLWMVIDDILNVLYTPAMENEGASEWYLHEPHTHRTDESWMRLFAERGVSVVYRHFHQHFLSNKDVHGDTVDSIKKQASWPVFVIGFYLLEVDSCITK